MDFQAVPDSIQLPSQTHPGFYVVTPAPWTLEDQDEGDLNKLRDEAMDKIRTCENRMNPFYQDYQVFADSWRVKSARRVSNKPQSLFNSKSGETHRAGETLATFWLRSMTAADRYFEAIAEGLDDFGDEIAPEDLYATETVVTKQLRVSHYKEKLYRSLNSIAIFGTAVFEEPFVRIPYKNGLAYFEYTDFVFRSLLKTFFDTNVWDVNLSPFMATVDFPDKYTLKTWSKSQGENWNSAKIKDFISRGGGIGQNSNSSMNSNTNAWNRVNESKTRAGYTTIDGGVSEFINYHGKLDVENSVIASYWEKSLARQDDPQDFDFTLGILNGTESVRFHLTQNGTWHSRFKVAHFKTFEDEPIAYGAGRLGRKGQREMDVQMSRVNDAIMKGVYSMYLVGRYAGLKANQIGINPNGLIDVEDVDQVKPLPIDIGVIAQQIATLAAGREEFRSTVGASTNLQAILTKSSATESAIAQTEAVRGASVHAEIIAETFLREHVETMHMNNLEYLDEPVWVAATGQKPPGYYNKDNLPRNVGIQIKIVTDKDFNKEARGASLLKGLELWSSIRSEFPPSVNAIPWLAKEWFRMMDMDPNLLTKPMSVKDQLAQAMSHAQRQGTLPAPANEVQGEAASAGSQGNANVSIPTPVGPVPTSPLGAAAQVGGLS